MKEVWFVRGIAERLVPKLRILKKFDLVNVKAAITPMETKVPLTKDEEAIDVDVTPKTSHLNAIKRIFKYLKGKPNLGLWYPRESPFDLEAFSDSNYGGSNLTRKSTTRYALTSNPTIYDSLVKQFWQTATTNTKADGTLEINATIDTIGVKKHDAVAQSPTIITPTPPGHLLHHHPSLHHPPNFSPLQEQAHGQIPIDDLLQVVPQLISRIDSLETDLKQTKLAMGNALVKLVKKVKKLEGFLKKEKYGLLLPSPTQVMLQGRNKLEDLSPEYSEAAKKKEKQLPPLFHVASLKPKSIDKGRRYKRRKETKGKKVVSSLDFQEEVNTAEGVNTGSIKISTVSEQVSTVSAKRSTPSL
ncbi:hypothetical protein Tco_0718445 [Tanacetum coccineum]